MHKSFNAKYLLFTTLLISICSIIYELIIGGLSSYLLGNSITQFSITIGLYLFAMGIGSFFSKYIHRFLFDSLILVEILVGLLGSFSSLLLFLSHIYTDVYPLVMYVMISSIGFLVGLEIPLLIRIIESHKQKMKSTIANLFGFDYLGGLIGSLAFPLFLLPTLGFVTTAFVTGFINLAAAAVIILKYRDEIRYKSFFQALLAVCLVVNVYFILTGNRLTKNLESGLYRDQIICSKQSVYQKIVLTKHKDDLRMFLDGNVQFSSLDEYRYHEPMVHVPMSVFPKAKNILLLGAGDGLAAKELLKYSGIESIIIVDLDKEVIDISKTNKDIVTLNKGSLNHKKVSVVYEDAYMFLQKNHKLFDVVIVDLPDPNNDALNKLYTTSFYRLVKKNLHPQGVLVTQSTSPYYTKTAFWCVNKTLQQEFSHVVPYHVYVPSFGEWGFNLASEKNISLEKLSLPQGITYQYLNQNSFRALFSFANDEYTDLNKIDVNTLFNPCLVRYYEKDISQH